MERGRLRRPRIQLKCLQEQAPCCRVLIVAHPPKKTLVNRNTRKAHSNNCSVLQRLSFLPGCVLFVCTANVLSLQINAETAIHLIHQHDYVVSEVCVAVNLTPWSTQRCIGDAERKLTPLNVPGQLWTQFLDTTKSTGLHEVKETSGLQTSD